MRDDSVMYDDSVMSDCSVMCDSSVIWWQFDVMLDSVMRHDSVMLCFQAHERLCAGQPAPVVEVEGLQPPEMSRGAILSYLQVSISKFCGDEY
jgi:hypothetical protein